MCLSLSVHGQSRVVEMRPMGVSSRPPSDLTDDSLRTLARRRRRTTRPKSPPVPSATAGQPPPSKHAGPIARLSRLIMPFADLPMPPLHRRQDPHGLEEKDRRVGVWVCGLPAASSPLSLLLCLFAFLGDSASQPASGPASPSNKPCWASGSISSSRSSSSSSRPRPPRGPR
jgi:hypothetical protein